MLQNNKDVGVLRDNKKLSIIENGLKTSTEHIFKRQKCLNNIYSAKCKFLKQTNLKKILKSDNL